MVNGFVAENIKSVRHMEQLSGSVINARGGNSSGICISKTSMFYRGFLVYHSTMYRFGASCSTKFLVMSQAEMKQKILILFSFLKPRVRAKSLLLF